MYLLDFVNLVREAQGCAEIERLPSAGARGEDPLELAMGCLLEGELMRLRSVELAVRVSRATGLPLHRERESVALPAPLVPHAAAVAASRARHDRVAGARPARARSGP